MKESTKILLKVILFFPIAYLYFFLMILGMFFIFGDDNGAFLMVVGLIFCPLLSCGLSYITLSNFFKNDKSLTNEEAKSTNEEIESLTNTSSQNKSDFFPKIIKFIILTPIFTIIIIFVFIFIDIILESLFSFYLFEKYFFYIGIISSILGLIFGLASITDIPEDKKN